MKRKIAILGLVVAAVSLSGCYYDPGYSYVRNSGYQGDVYYGRSAPVYDDGYYGAPGYYDYYGYTTPQKAEKAEAQATQGSQA